MTETYWQGEAEARITANETRLNSLNGDLREIRQHMSNTRDDLLLLRQRVNALDTNVTTVLQRSEKEQGHQIELLQQAIDHARVRTRNLIFLLLVPLLAAMMSGLIPYLILNAPHK